MFKRFLSCPTVASHESRSVHFGITHTFIAWWWSIQCWVLIFTVERLAFLIYLNREYLSMRDLLTTMGSETYNSRSTELPTISIWITNGITWDLSLQLTGIHDLGPRFLDEVNIFSWAVGAPSRPGGTSKKPRFSYWKVSLKQKQNYNIVQADSVYVCIVI